MRRVLLVVLLLVGVAGLVAWRFPLGRIVPSRIPGLEVQSVTGTIWDGQVRGARYQGIDIGDVDLRLLPRTLLSGPPQVQFDRLQGPISGRVSLSREVRRVEGVTGELALPLGPTGIAARIALADVLLETELGGACRAVNGEVRATLTGIPLIGTTPSLSGTPVCDGAAIRVPMQLADRSVGLDLSLQPDRRWQADLSLGVPNPLLRTLLGAIGFAVVNDRATLSVAGELR
jgi:general secretion pathway protein N